MSERYNLRSRANSPDRASNTRQRSNSLMTRRVVELSGEAREPVTTAVERIPPLSDEIIERLSRLNLADDESKDISDTPLSENNHDDEKNLLDVTTREFDIFD